MHNINTNSDDYQMGYARDFFPMTFLKVYKEILVTESLEDDWDRHSAAADFARNLYAAVSRAYWDAHRDAHRDAHDTSEWEMLQRRSERERREAEAIGLDIMFSNRDCWVYLRWNAEAEARIAADKDTTEARRGAEEAVETHCNASLQTDTADICTTEAQRGAEEAVETHTADINTTEAQRGAEGDAGRPHSGPLCVAAGFNPPQIGDARAGVNPAPTTDASSPRNAVVSSQSAQTKITFGIFLLQGLGKMHNFATNADCACVKAWHKGIKTKENKNVCVRARGPDIDTDIVGYVYERLRKNTNAVFGAGKHRCGRRIIPNARDQCAGVELGLEAGLRRGGGHRGQGLPRPFDDSA